MDEHLQWFTINIYLHSRVDLRASVPLRKLPTSSFPRKWSYLHISRIILIFMYSKYNVCRAHWGRNRKMCDRGPNKHHFCWNLTYEFRLAYITNEEISARQLKKCQFWNTIVIIFHILNVHVTINPILFQLSADGKNLCQWKLATYLLISGMIDTVLIYVKLVAQKYASRSLTCDRVREVWILHIQKHYIRKNNLVTPKSNIK